MKKKNAGGSPAARSMGRRLLPAASLIGALLLAAALPASATVPGCEYKAIDPATYGKQPFQNPPEIASYNGALDTVMTLQYTDPKTTSLGGCPLKLRSYNGQLVGPTLRIKPGDVINLTLDNKLPRETPDQVQKQFEQESTSAHLSTMPASFNTTNVHYHGLHVSPTGNSDNVLLAIEPQSKFPYEVKLPADHPIGSYWYHAHAHGSTSIQVGSGVAGAIIVEDDPQTIPKALLAANAREKVFMLQTTLYNEDGELNDITKLFPGPSTPSPKDCSAASGNEGTWPCAQRRITINGQIVPIITMKRGEVQRWRLIDSAFRESISFAVEKHDLHEIALDGNYLGRVDTWTAGTPLDLEPGYRSDVLIKASMTPGEYRILDKAEPATKSLRAAVEAEHVLAILRVSDEIEEMALPTSAEMAPLAPFGDLDLRKTALGVQEVVFKLGEDTNPVPTKQKNYFQINYQAFSPTHIRELALNSTDMWALTTVGDPTGVPNGIPPLPHVFHIHVNPFQWSRTGPDGKPELVWKDTLLVQGPTITNVYTHYKDYIGQFVIHCHILDHEDLGMMEVVEVVDTANGVRNPHHH